MRGSGIWLAISPLRAQYEFNRSRKSSGRGTAIPILTAACLSARLTSSNRTLLHGSLIRYVPTVLWKRDREQQREPLSGAAPDAGTLRTAAPNWQQWLIFFLPALQKQERRLAAKVERERVVIAALPELDLQILDYIRQHGRATMADMVRATGASRNTLKDHFRSLVEKGHLTRQEPARFLVCALKRE